MKLDYRLGNKKIHTSIEFFKNLALAIGGSLLFSLAMNIFVVPLKFYSGGLIGFAQLIRSYLIDNLGFSKVNFDMASLIYYFLNIPLLILAYKKLGKTFFYRTLLLSTIFTLSLLLVPIPKEALIKDPLTASIIAGALCGYGIGSILRAGYSAGGPDILGLYFIRYGKNISVGQINLFTNIIVFSICALLYNFETVVYSFILNMVISITVDRVHFQNILVQVTIFSKVDGIKELILNNINRGVTSWKGVGGYTGEDTNIHLTMVSKYELEKLYAMVKTVDPNAFIMSTEGISIRGNFEKRV